MEVGRSSITVVVEFTIEWVRQMLCSGTPRGAATCRGGDRSVHDQER